MIPTISHHPSVPTVFNPSIAVTSTATDYLQTDVTSFPTDPSFWMAGREVEFSSCAVKDAPVLVYMYCCVVLIYKCKCNLIYNKFW
jgi:hypothetical protein